MTIINSLRITAVAESETSAQPTPEPATGHDPKPVPSTSHPHTYLTKIHLTD